mgnify:CR=1 FL=1
MSNPLRDQVETEYYSQEYPIKWALDEITRLREDKARLEFLFSCLNEMEFFYAFVNRWHPTRSTSLQRTNDADWRETIDAARDWRQALNAARKDGTA